MRRRGIGTERYASVQRHTRDAAPASAPAHCACSRRLFTPPAHARRSAASVRREPPPRAVCRTPLDAPAVPRRRVARGLASPGRLLLAGSNSVSNGRARRHHQPLVRLHSATMLQGEVAMEPLVDTSCSASDMSTASTVLGMACLKFAPVITPL